MPRAVLDMISLVASFVCGRWWVLHINVRFDNGICVGL